MAKKRRSTFGKIVRRTFLTAGAVVVGGVAFGAYWVSRDHDNPLVAGEGEGVFNPFVKLSTDGTITVITPRAEMGQGIQTTLAAMVAEELDVPVSAITTEHGPAAPAYYNAGMLEEGAFPPTFHGGLGADGQRHLLGVMGKALGLQVTGGSSSVIDGFDKMREAGAQARAALVQAAANRWGVSPDTVATENGTVRNTASEESIPYADLVLEAAEVEIETPALKPRRDWRVLGKRQMRTDIAEKVTGAPIFGIDVQLPDMLYGTVKISPRFGARAVRFDDAAARAVPGVLSVHEIETTTGSGFGIVATNTWAAFEGARALDVEWGEAPYPADDAGIAARLVEAIEGESSQSLMDRGDVDEVFADPQGARVIEAEYSVPYLAHATMEPMNATAWLRDGVLDVWTGTQAPGIVQSRCAAHAGLDKDSVNVNTTFLGGGFGRRGEVDFPLYATALAMQVEGRPIKVTWSREEDTTHDTYRPAALARMRAVVPEGGRADTVEIKVASPSIIKSVLGRTYPNLSAAGPDKTMTDGAYNQPVNYDNFRVSGHAADLDIPIGFWRSVGHSYNCFFHEGFMDEQAEAAGMDPLAYRLAVMEGDDRLDPARGVLNKVAEMSGWGRAVEAGRGLGLAQSLCFGTWIAMVVEVDAREDVRIEKVWAAADPGIVMDPRLFRDQIIGGAIYGFSSALGEEINFVDGEVQQQNFWDYSFMSMEQCPEFEIELLQTSPHVGGAGEVGTPPAVPALANAIYAATGQRLRQMPLSREVAFRGV